MNINIIRLFERFCLRMQFILFGFRPKLTSHFIRSPLPHRHDYGAAGDHTNCLASFALNSEPFMRYTG